MPGGSWYSVSLDVAALVGELGEAAEVGAAVGVHAAVRLVEEEVDHGLAREGVGVVAAVGAHPAGAAPVVERRVALGAAALLGAKDDEAVVLLGVAEGVRVADEGGRAALGARAGALAALLLDVGRDDRSEALF